MKVPTLQSNRVAEGQGALAYLQTPSNLGDGWNAVAAGLKSLGGALGQYDAALKERGEKTKKFDALTALNDFELEGDVTQTELKRQADVSGKDFAKQSSELWNKRAEEFISKRIPEDLREEFKYRLSENRQKVLRDAYDFEYKAGDAWYRKGIEEQFVKAQNEVGMNPDKLPEWQAKIDEVINASDLSQAEKDDLRDKAQLGLVSIDYFNQVKKNAKEAVDQGVGPIDDDLEGAKAIIRKEEGAATHSYWDVNHERIGYGSDTITRDGKQYSVKKGDRVTKEEAEADLQYRLEHREGAAVRRQLGDDWEKLPKEVRAALYSVGYNYGSLPSNIVRAAKSGDMQALATEVEGLSANKSRRKREADIIRGSRSIDLDEKYAAIPFDDRVKMRDAAEREAKATYNEEQRLLKEQQTAARNDLFTGLYDGTKNEVDIQAARDAGLLNHVDHLIKADKLLKDHNEQVNLTTGFIEDRKAEKPYDPTDDKQKKGYNAVIGPSGLDKIANGDQEYFNQTIKPLYEQTGALATDVAGLLQGMMRSGVMKHKQFAIDALSQLQDINPVAFAAQVPEALQRQVDYWDARKGFYEKPEELLTQLEGGTTQEERQRRLSLRKDAEQILSKTEAGVPTIETLMTDVLGEFDNSSMPWNANPHYASDPVQKQAIYSEFQTHFIDEYERYGTVEEAKAAAIKTLKSTWGVSPVGDGSTIMKFPPDKVGYKPGADGTYSWIDQQVKEEFKLMSDTTFELFADEKTRQEWEKFRTGKSSTPPTYRVMLKDANGVWRDPTDDPTKRPRIWFQKPLEEKIKEETRFDFKNELFNLQTRMAEIIQMKMALDRAKPGEQLPQEILDEEKDIQERLGTLKDPAAEVTPDTGEMPSVDIMGNPN